MRSITELPLKFSDLTSFNYFCMISEDNLEQLRNNVEILSLAKDMAQKSKHQINMLGNESINEDNDATLLQHGHSHGANNGPRPSLQYDEIKESDSKSHAGLFDGLGKIKTIAWLLTIGDGLHNFLGKISFDPSKLIKIFAIKVVSHLSQSL